MHRKQRMKTLAIPPIVLLLLAYWTYVATEQDIRSFLPALIFSTIWVIILLVNYEKYTINGLLASLRTPGHEKIYGSYILKLDDNGLYSISPLGESSYHWHAVTSAELSRQYLIINLIGNTAFPIPIDAIGLSKAQAARDFIQQKISSPPALPAKPSSI